MESIVKPAVRPEVYRLKPDPEVNRNALEVLGGRQPGLDRSLAFLVLDRELQRLAKAEAVINLHLGHALGPLLGGGYEALGYARVEDYCIEQLGFGRRAAELLRQQAERMSRHPEIRHVFLQGLINESKARLLLAHVERVGGTETDLIALASGLTVRGLKERLAKVAQEPGDGRQSGTASAPAADDGHGCAMDVQEPAPAGVNLWPGPGPGSLAPDHQAEAQDAAGEESPLAGAFFRFRLSPALVASWDQVLEHFRRMEESDLKPWQVLELLAADVLAGLPRPEAPVAGALGSGSSPAGGPEEHGGLEIADGQRTSGSRPDGRWDRQNLRDDTRIDWREMLEGVAHCWDWLEQYQVQVDLAPDFASEPPAEPAAEPAKLNARCRELLLCRRRLHVYLGRMLRTLANYGLARQALFSSICHYSAERLGLGGSTTFRLIQRERRLIRRPLVTAALLDGRIGVSQADALLRLPDHVPDDAWIAFAERRTTRGVEDEVNDFLAFARLQPEQARLRRWRPREASEAAPVASDTRRGVDTGVTSAGTSGLPMFSQAVPPTDPQWDAQGEALRIFVPHEVVPVIEAALEATRQAAGVPLTDGECLVLWMQKVEASYSEFERAIVARRRRALQRWRYRCAVPGCRNRRGLHVHHIVFRSHGGTDDDHNLVVLCPCHHLRGVHEGRLRVHGLGTDLLWELGIRKGQAYMVFKGEVQVA